MTQDTSAIQTGVADVIQEIPTVVKDVKTGNVDNMLADAQRSFVQLAPLAGTIVQETKAGYKTTEFWLTLASVILTQLGALDLPGHWGKIVVTASVIVAYIISRGVAKAGVGQPVTLGLPKGK